METAALPVYFEGAEEGGEPPPARRARVRPGAARQGRTASQRPAPAPPPRRPVSVPLWPGDDRGWSPCERPWPDLSVRRIVPGDAPAVVAALGRLLGAAGGADGRTRPAYVATGAGRLAVRGAPARAGDESRVRAVVRPRHGLRAVAVELVVAPWAPGRAELALRVVGGRRLRWPGRRYFAAAHAVADRLQALLAGRVGPAPA